MSDLTRRVWERDFANVSKAIPQEWLMTVEGQQYIVPEHADEPIVRTYQSLLQVGYAKGWMP